MPRGRHRASFDQDSEFNRRRTVVNRDCGLSFKEIGLPVVRNQATVMRICHPSMQEEMTSRPHPLHCTTVSDDR
ncbi:hypothetical protein TNCV_4932441 [Trichonephila clavipes]|nr:hypothetical protein TNCV_4932441 [Trichonephila clavipes]